MVQDLRASIVTAESFLEDMATGGTTVSKLIMFDPESHQKWDELPVEDTANIIGELHTISKHGLLSNKESCIMGANSNTVKY